MSKESVTSELDKALTRYSLKNDDLVRASVEQLTHKQVQKARRGKPITPNIQGKIVRALNAVVEGAPFTQKGLF